MFCFFDLQFTCTFLLDIRFTTVTRSVSPGRHRPAMALTRAMAAKLASQSSVVERDVSSSPSKTSPRHRYPSSSSSSSTSSASSSSSFSPPLTPTTLVNDSPPSISLVSLFNNFVDNVSQKFHDMFQKIEHISNRMSNIEESIGDQHFIINELDRELAIIADRLKKYLLPNVQITLFLHLFKLHSIRVRKLITIISVLLLLA